MQLLNVSPLVNFGLQELDELFDGNRLRICCAQTSQKRFDIHLVALHEEGQSLND